MYSLQLRRGIARGRIWHTSALINRFLEDVSVQSYDSSVPTSRGFHSSQQGQEPSDGNKGDNDGAGRAMPKLSFADFLRKRESGLSSAPVPTARTSSAAQIPDPVPTRSAPPVQEKTFPAVPERTFPTSTFNTSQYSHPPSMETPPSREPPPQQQQQQPQQPSQTVDRNVRPKIRRFITGPMEGLSSLMSKSSEADESATGARAARRARRTVSRAPRTTSESEAGEATGSPNVVPTTSAEREAAAQARAYAHIHNVVPENFQDSRFAGRGGGGSQGRGGSYMRGRTWTTGGGGQGRSEGQVVSRSFTPSGGGTPSSFGIRRTPSTKPMTLQDRLKNMGTRGRGRGGGRGTSRGRGRGRGRAKMTKSDRDKRMKQSEEEDREWLEMTANPQPPKEGEIEPHPVYDTTLPYFPDVSGLETWIPPVGGRSTVGARKLLNHNKPKHEPIVAWAEKALLGDGIIRPGENITAVNATQMVSAEGVLGAAELSIRQNPSYTEKNQGQFLAVLKSKLAPREQLRR